MWYGPNSFCLFPRERLLSFPHARRVEELPTGAVFIELYDDPFAAENPENRHVQQSFRDWMEMDQIPERAQRIFGDRVDPGLEIEHGEFEGGGVRRWTEWLTPDLDPSRRSIAHIKRVSILGPMSELISQETTKLK
jgi:hypothetical protein